MDFSPKMDFLPKVEVVPQNLDFLPKKEFLQANVDFFSNTCGLLPHKLGFLFTQWASSPFPHKLDFLPIHHKLDFLPYSPTKTYPLAKLHILRLLAMLHLDLLFEIESTIQNKVYFALCIKTLPVSCLTLV